MTKKVMVLMGGFSAEREVSLQSGAGIAEALRRKGYEVTTNSDAASRTLYSTRCTATGAKTEPSPRCWTCFKSPIPTPACRLPVSV